jgi:hypothetical protein
LTLTLESIQQREERWVIADLVGRADMCGMAGSLLRSDNYEPRERAGRVKAASAASGSERSLDVPKRSRTIVIGAG